MSRNVWFQSGHYFSRPCRDPSNRKHTAQQVNIAPAPATAIRNVGRFSQLSSTVDEVAKILIGAPDPVTCVRNFGLWS